MSLRLTEVEGNIFTATPDYSLAHCVGADLRMGRGIAIEFRNRFGQTDRLKSQKVDPGGVAILQVGDRFIYYLITKQLSHQSPTYERLFQSLNAMRNHMLNNGVNKLAIPRLGSGLDRLDWARVKSQIIEIFAHDSVEIVVYNYIQNKN